MINENVLILFGEKKKKIKVMDVTLAVTSRAKNSNYNIAKQNEKPEQFFLFLLEFSIGI